MSTRYWAVGGSPEPSSVEVTLGAARVAGVAGRVALAFGVDEVLVRAVGIAGSSVVSVGGVTLRLGKFIIPEMMQVARVRIVSRSRMVFISLFRKFFWMPVL